MYHLFYRVKFMYLRRFICCLCAAGIVLTFSGCSTDGIKDIQASKYVQLPDYHSIEIGAADTEITTDDIENIISWDLTAADAYITDNSHNIVTEDDVVLLTPTSADDTEYTSIYYYVSDETLCEKNTIVGKKVGDSIEVFLDDSGDSTPVEITSICRIPTMDDQDYILNFYSLSSMNEVDSMIRERAKETIIYYYSWDIIVNNTVITDMPSEIKQLIQAEEDALSAEASEQNLDVSEYLKLSNLTYDDWYSSVSEKYTDYLISKAILENDGVSVSDEQIQNYITQLCSEYDVSEEEIKNIYDSDSLYIEVVMDLAEEIIVKSTIIR